jgi:predicted DNA-binding transcriptional regulator AlpA
VSNKQKNETPAAYLSTAEASHLTGLSPAWFERSRWAGGGPPFVKLGAAVRYPVDELHAWMRARIRRSTHGGGGAMNYESPRSGRRQGTAVCSDGRDPITTPPGKFIE